MAKWHGIIGYSISEETTPGVWTDKITERKHFGDAISIKSRWQSNNSITDNLTLNTQISIIADPFARKNFGAMRYIEFMGTCWEISDVAVQYPRLILTTGGVYNGKQA